jgi:hypothetical protein
MPDGWARQKASLDAALLLDDGLRKRRDDGFDRTIGGCWTSR